MALLSTPLEKSRLAKILVPMLLVAASLVAGLFLFELAYHLFFPATHTQAQTDNAAQKRIIFFDGRDTVFRNVKDIFTYLPRDEVRNVTLFFSDKDYKIEYDYRFRTNNLGLVQDSDVVPGRDSMLLLGDSFTEGQGAEPWFRLVSPQIEQFGLQPINGGMMGTGFGQWLKLQQHLSAEGIRVRKLIVLFISADYIRGLWKFYGNELLCISSLKQCPFERTMAPGWGPSLFFRLPPQEEMPFWIDKIRASRNRPVSGNVHFDPASLLPGTFTAYQYAKRVVHERRADSAIAQLIQMNGAENVTFFHLPQKDELDSGPNELGIKVRQSIQQAGGKLIDGFQLCHLTSADYYPRDDHPNHNGYAKIASCVGAAIRQQMTAQQKQ